MAHLLGKRLGKQQIERLRCRISAEVGHCLKGSSRGDDEDIATTALDPSYPGAHAVVSADAALVLAGFFGSNTDKFTVTSEVLPGVERSFTSFTGAAQEASNSRIYAGQHFRYDQVAGQLLGFRVAGWVLRNFLTSLSPSGH